MKLFVDDIRACPDGWELARTNTKALRILSTSPVPVEEISIDHDICCQMERVSGQGFATHTSNETYMPVVYFILMMPRELRPKIVHIHTANTYAGNVMMDLLKDQVDTLDRDWSFAEHFMTEKDFKQWEDQRRQYE